MMKNTWEKVPKEYKDMLVSLAHGNDAEILGKAIEYLDTHAEDYKKEGSEISEEVYLLMVENFFARDFMVLAECCSDGIWPDNKDKLGHVLASVEEILQMIKKDRLIPEHRTEESAGKYDDITALCQNMHLYLAYYYYYCGDNKNYKKEVKEVLTATEKNMRYALSLGEEKSTELLKKESWLIGEDVEVYDTETWSEPLASFYNKFYSEEVIPVYENYLEFLYRARYEVQSKATLELVVIPKVRERLKELYLDILESVEDEIISEEEKLVKLCKKRKKLNKKIRNLEHFDAVYLPF